MSRSFRWVFGNIPTSLTDCTDRRDQIDHRPPFQHEPFRAGRSYIFGSRRVLFNAHDD